MISKAHNNSRLRKCLFLDRDGIINIDHGYVGKIEDFQFIDGIFELCRAAQRRGYLIVVVTNQSGIARGYYDRSDFLKLTRWMRQQFWRQGIQLQQVIHCPHHPKASGHLGIRCSCRKPEPGMLIKAQRLWNLDLSQSLMVGDSLRDMEAAAKAGVPEKHRLLLSEYQSLARSSGYRRVRKLKQAIGFL